MARTFSAIPGSKRTAVPGAKALGRANANTVIEVTVKVRRKAAPPPLEGRPDTTMTRAQLADQFGASQSDIDTVEKTLEGFGLTVVAADALTRTVRFSGTVAQIEAAFQVNLYNYTSDNGNYRGRVGTISVPSEVQGIIEGVFGLDNRRIAKRRRHPVLDESGAKSLPASWYIPSQLATHYNFPAGDGSGQTVGILEFGGGYFPSDLQMFCNLASVTVPQVTAISTDGTPTNSDDDAAGEVMLDIEIVGAVANGAAIAVYFAPNTDQGFIDAITTAVHDTTNNPSVLSISWGGPEDSWTAQARQQMEQAFTDAGTLGISVTAAAGDNGSTDGSTDGAQHVDFPASAPHALGCGGTSLRASGASITSEVVWNTSASGGGATGGGVSIEFALPGYQQAADVPDNVDTGDSGRGVPDVAANADPDTGYQVRVDGSDEVFGGTSAAAPLWAGLIVLLNQSLGASLGFAHARLYALLGTDALRDITSGDNGAYSAGVGWDACTGLGSPNGAGLASALASDG